MRHRNREYDRERRYREPERMAVEDILEGILYAKDGLQSEFPEVVEESGELLAEMVHELRLYFQAEHDFEEWDETSETLFLVQYPEARS